MFNPQKDAAWSIFAWSESQLSYGPFLALPHFACPFWLSYIMQFLLRDFPNYD